jgi:hypothetical protein
MTRQLKKCSRDARLASRHIKDGPRTACSFERDPAVPQSDTVQLAALPGSSCFVSLRFMKANVARFCLGHARRA